MTSTSYWNLAVPCPLRRLFCYRDDLPVLLRPGDWVEVSFGSRKVRALVVEPLEAPPAGIKVKSIQLAGAVDDRLPDSLLELIRWAIRYYHAAPWDVVTSLVPTLLSRGRMPDAPPYWMPVNPVAIEQVSSRARRQIELLEYLDEKGPCNSNQIRAAGFSSGLEKQLREKGLVKQVPAPKVSKAKPVEPDLAPNTAQQDVIERVLGNPDGRFLLEGVTGSGKSLVYQRLTARMIEGCSGSQILVLVPEIGLVEPMVSHLRALSIEVCTYHSGMTDKERAEVWASAKSGNLSVVVGTRSAVALPMPNLRLIILDEEHDSSYKQQEGMRYQARDLAMLRAAREQVGLVLGSATPSLESLNNVRNGSLQHLQLAGRVGDAAMPDWQLLPATRNPDQPFSGEAIDIMGEVLKRGEQLMVFLNRRGFSPALQCRDCGWTDRCPRCEVRLTWHRSRQEMRCHQCDDRRKVPDRCGHCHSRSLKPVGTGTERIEAQIQQLFPAVPVIRIDRDSVRGRYGFQEKLQQVFSKGPAVLVGTQMLAKGHHFPNLSLAVLLDLDFALQSADFRALEQAMQLATQVAGRTGREKHQGRVLMQTDLPSHPALARMVANDYAGFAREELDKRYELNLPPSSHLALIRSESASAAQAEQLLRGLKLNSSCQMIGPVPCFTERRQGRFRFQIQLASPSRSELHRQLDLWVVQLAQRNPREVRWYLDIDPVSLDG